jgi:hypothetical protein
MIAVKIIPKIMFNHRLRVGETIHETEIIREGMARTMEAINKFTGVFKLFDPLSRLSILSGTYNSK